MSNRYAIPVTIGNINGDLIPSGDDTYDIGSATAAWQDLFLEGDIALSDATTIAITAAAHDAAGPALTISAGDTTAGTSNNQVGGAVTIQGGQGKGSGAGGDIIFQTANAGSSGSSLNALATALTISDDLSSTFAGNISIAAGGSSAATSGATNFAIHGGSSHTGMTIYAADNKRAQIYFGGASNTADATIRWVHDSGKLYVQTNNTAHPVVLNPGGGNILIGTETANTDQAETGSHLTIDQGASDDAILAFKSSDVGHAMTAAQEATTFVSVGKVEATSGGALIDGYKDADGVAGKAVVLRGNLGETADTTHTTSGVGVVQVDAQITDGSTGTTAIAADGNAFIVSNALTAEFIVKGDGELYSNESATVATFDAYDDAQLIRVLDHVRQSPTVIRERWDDFVQYNEQDLVEAGILGDTRENGGMLNITGLQRLHNGAIWQGYVRQQEMQERIDELEQKLSVVNELEKRLLAVEGV